MGREFVGQQRIWNSLSRIIDRAKAENGILPSLLFCGQAEMGKITLAHRFASVMGGPIRSTKGTPTDQLKPGDLAAILTNLEEGSILHIFHPEPLNKDTAKCLLEALEDFSFELVVGKGSSARRVDLPVNPFSFIGTTSLPSQIDKRLLRWCVRYTFDEYTFDEKNLLFRQLGTDEELGITPEAGVLLASAAVNTVGDIRVLVKRLRRHFPNHDTIDLDDANAGLEALGYRESASSSSDFESRLRRMTGREFKTFVADVFQRKGYTVEITPETGDHGIDIILWKADRSIPVQCKNWSKPIGEPPLRDFYGAMQHKGAEEGYFVTSSAFTRRAYQFAEGKPIQLIDLDSLMEIWNEVDQSPDTAGISQDKGGEDSAGQADHIAGGRASAEQGNSQAQYNLGASYYNGDGVPQDYEQALWWFRKAAEQGHADAQYMLGVIYYKGRRGVPQDYEQALWWSRKAAEQGHADAQRILGVIYYRGDGVPQDHEQALWWSRKAAEQGHADAQFVLGVIYDEGDGVPQDYEQALWWFRKAAEQGHAYAQYTVGAIYDKGRGVSQDQEQALWWFRKAAEQGDSQAQCNLGASYYNGDGVPQDYEQALWWFRKAAVQGESQAQYNLGVIYNNGEGLPQDYHKARKWYRKAAEQGHADAQNSLREMDGYCRELLQE